MVKENTEICPACGGKLQYYDNVLRIVRSKYRISQWIKIRRMRCPNCQTLHRELPDYIFPFKQYESEMILGVLEDIITADTYGFEDYPCEQTMKRWISQKEHILLWK